MDGAIHQRRKLPWNHLYPVGASETTKSTHCKPHRSLIRALSFRAVKRRFTDPSSSLEDFEMRGFDESHRTHSGALDSHSSPSIIKRTSCSESTSSLPRKGCLKISSHFESLNRSYYESSLTSAESVETDSELKHDKTGEYRTRLLHPQSRSVRFTTVQIHLHSRRLGDNPSVSSGPPVALGRRLISSTTHDVDSYENARAPRPKSSLVLSRLDREDMLKECGYGRSDFAVAEQEMFKVKLQRQASAKVTIAERTWSKVKCHFGDKATRSALRVPNPNSRID